MSRTLAAPAAAPVHAPTSMKWRLFVARPAVSAMLASLLAVSMVIAYPGPASAAVYPILDDPVEGNAPEAPTVCSDGYVYPGVYALRDILASSYGDRTASLARACPATVSSSMSYHSRGLALDWRFNVYDPSEEAEVQQVLNWLFEANSAGEKQIRLKRLGIIQVIWNDKIWLTNNRNATSDIQTWRAYDFSSCVAGGGGENTCAHRDHIHFSFSLEGGNMQRSWWSPELARYRDTPTTSAIVRRFLPPVTRIGGATRYDTAIGVSQQYFPDGASTVYIASGANFPDALGAAPAAALRSAPLLLVEPGSVPPVIQSELVRLKPDRIIVAGGPAAVSDEVLAQLGGYAPSVTRISGADRYQTSRDIARDAFGTVGATVAYIASGSMFPDALSASAAAGSVDAPVILLDGQMPSLDAATAALLTDLGVTDVRIAGGPLSVMPGIETALRSLPGVTSVTRLGGADRFETSGAINRAAFTSSDVVFIASGVTFPDALAGAAVAGAMGAPLYVVPTSCVPGYVLDDVVSFGATDVRILGGPVAVTPEAAALMECR